MTNTSWENHYTRDKSVLVYPDENLVRMIKKYLNINKSGNISAIDLGCGTGRHLKMLAETGVSDITGLDNSANALDICRKLYPFNLVQGDNAFLPFRDSAFDIAVSWGSLHYCIKNNLLKQIHEIHRIMNNRGFFFGTLRSERDTYLKKGKDLGNGTWITDLKDIENSIVSFFDENELKSYFKIFKRIEYGLIERTIIGDTTKIISHWIFQAEKE